MRCPGVSRRLLTCGLLLCACATEDPPGDTDGTAHLESPRPFEDAWVLEIDQPFDPSLVHSLRVGGRESSDNFANRGDIQIRYADTDRIQVEVRRFTFASDEADAQADFDRLSVWAYASAGNPSPPSQMDPDDDCVDPSGQAQWADGCQIRVVYDGLVQLARAGADFRVTLPRGFVGALEVTTEDNAADADYHDRARVCVQDLPGLAEIQLGAGEAFVILAADVTPFPLCSPEDIADCESVEWTQGCACLAAQGQASGLTVRSGAGQAADATVDVPEDLWARYSLRIMGSSGDCTTSADAGAGLLQPNLDLQGPGLAIGTINEPPPPAQQGVGYSLSLQSDDCAVVSSTASPDDFVGQGHGEEQDTLLRGDLGVCAGCLRTQGCDALLGSD